MSLFYNMPLLGISERLNKNQEMRIRPFLIHPTTYSINCLLFSF